LLVAAGPLATAITGATVGAVTDSLVGALNGMGMPELEARLYEASLREGHSLVIVRVADVMTVQAMEILHHHRAIRVDQRNLQPTADDPTELSSPSTYYEN